MENLVLGLTLWNQLSAFIHIIETVNVDDEEPYEGKLDRFVENLKRFYTCGAKSFMSKIGDGTGDLDTFYLHALRFYLPVIAEYMRDKYRLGLGVYSMQGFERRNKESKNTLRRFTNKKGNVVQQNMYRLWDRFYYGYS